MFSLFILVTVVVVCRTCDLGCDGLYELADIVNDNEKGEYVPVFDMCERQFPCVGRQIDFIHLWGEEIECQGENDRFDKGKSKPNHVFKE
jgi:hypothetical protein